jgi:signal transduction histidine kinase/FixJ family two-component response regulator
MENKILLVDDEEGIRKVLSISLTDSGYKVLTAANGDEALKIFKKDKPPIVLTDIKMPGIDGITLLKEIKKARPDTEVIMITGHGQMDLAIESLQYEAVDFVTKPINNDALEIALKRATEKISMREQLRAYTENLETLVKEQSAKLVETERLTAVGQAIEGLSGAIKNIAGDLEGGIRYFNEMPCFVSIHDPALKIVETNQLYKERLGDRVGGNSWEIYKEKNGDQVSCPVKETFITGIGQRGRETIKYIDGKEFPVIVHTAPIRNKDGDIELVLEITADVSEVKLTAVNRQYKEAFGDHIGSRCYQVYKDHKEPCADCPVAKTFEDGKSHQSEMVVTSMSGEQYNVLVWTAPIKNAAGEITQVMEMSTNITQIRQLQDHLSSLGFLISSISHGMKGLLTGLDGGMYLVNSGIAKENQEQIKEGWEIVNLMVDRIRNLVQNILYYAKERELKWEKVNVLSFVSEVALTIEPKITGQNIEFVRDFDQSLGDFEIDPGVVRSALVNILENAVEASLEDKYKEKHQIVFGVKQDEEHIIFHVIDNGIGMDRETRESMFTLFFSSKGHRGTGLGLFISNKTIQQHGGTIEVDSTLGEGSHFRIMMPKTLPKASDNANRNKKQEAIKCD